MGPLRRDVALLVAACGALLWVGIAASSPGDPKKRLTAAGEALASSYLLRKADLPRGDWQARPASLDGPNPSCAVRHYSLGALTLEGEAGAIYEVAAGPVVESDAHVFVTAGQARRAFAKESRIGFARCLGASLASGTSGPEAVVRVGTLRFSGLAADASGFRIDVGPDAARDGPTLAAALVVLRHGRAIGVLSVITAESPWSRPALRSLTATMALRMARV